MGGGMEGEMGEGGSGWMVDNEQMDQWMMDE